MKKYILWFCWIPWFCCSGMEEGNKYPLKRGLEDTTLSKVGAKRIKVTDISPTLGASVFGDNRDLFADLNANNLRVNICSHLSIAEYTNMRLVNKKWKELTDQVFRALSALATKLTSLKQEVRNLRQSPNTQDPNKQMLSLIVDKWTKLEQTIQFLSDEQLLSDKQGIDLLCNVHRNLVAKVIEHINKSLNKEEAAATVNFINMCRLYKDSKDPYRLFLPIKRKEDEKWTNQLNRNPYTDDRPVQKKQINLTSGIITYMVLWRSLCKFLGCLYPKEGMPHTAIFVTLIWSPCLDLYGYNKEIVQVLGAEKDLFILLNRELKNPLTDKSELILKTLSQRKESPSLSFKEYKKYYDSHKNQYQTALKEINTTIKDTTLAFLDAEAIILDYLAQKVYEHAEKAKEKIKEEYEIYVKEENLAKKSCEDKEAATKKSYEETKQSGGIQEQTQMKEEIAQLNKQIYELTRDNYEIAKHNTENAKKAFNSNFDEVIEQEIEITLKIMDDLKAILSKSISTGISTPNAYAAMVKWMSLLPKLLEESLKEAEKKEELLKKHQKQQQEWEKLYKQLKEKKLT